MTALEAPGAYPPSTLEPSATVFTPDGVDVAVYDLGGSGRPVVLVHATGFCGAVLAPLAATLADSFHCVLLDLRAHGRSGVRPDGDLHWAGFATDVLAVVDDLGLDHPLGFGHSCGAAALVLAEERRPGTFGGLYLFEPIVLPLDRPPPTGRENPLSQGARRRRSKFASRDEALANFSSKAPFDTLRPDVLAAYVDNGFSALPEGGIGLRCTREHEAETFTQSFTHDAYAAMSPTTLSCDVTFACGEHTDAIGPDYLALYAQRRPEAKTVVFDGLDHFGPLQDPHKVGRAVRGALRSLSPGSDTPPA